MSYYAVLDVLHHQHQHTGGGFGNSCMVLVHSGEILIGPMYAYQYTIKYVGNTTPGWYKESDNNSC